VIPYSEICFELETRGEEVLLRITHGRLKLGEQALVVTPTRAFSRQCCTEIHQHRSLRLFAKQVVFAWVKVIEESGTATAEEITAATEAALPHWAPDV
jgi:hypothetical protein